MDCSKLPHLEFTRIGDYRLEFDGIDQRLPQSNILDGRIIKPIHIIPNCAQTIGIPSGRGKPHKGDSQMNTHN